MFHNREQAGLMLADRLTMFKNEAAIILAVPKGGVPVACSVAKELGLPFEIVLTKKIGHPMNKEYAIGAASLTDYFVIPHQNVSEKYITHEVKEIQQRLTEMYRKYMGNTMPEKLKGKTVIVIDDGVATGNTLLATIHVLRISNPARIVIAVPVASASAVHKLLKEADEVIALLIPDEFHGVGSFYENFEQVEDNEVLNCLNSVKQRQMPG